MPYLVAAGTACTGLAGMLLPNDDASPGSAAGPALVGWAVAFASAAAVVKPKSPRVEARRNDSQLV